MVNNKPAHPYYEILYALGIALVEIRSSTELEEAQVMADIFHNVPGMISLSESRDVVISEIMSKAKRHGLTQNIEKILLHAKKNNRT